MAKNLGWGHGWNVLAVCVLFLAFIYGIGLYTFTIWTTVWSREFGASPADFMAAISASTIISGLAAPFVGRALASIQPRLVIMTGVILFSSALALIALATRPWQIVTAYVTLVSTAMALAGPLPALSLAAEWFTRRRGLAIGIVSVGTSVGGFVFPSIVVHLLERYGWRQAHLILAAATFVVLVPSVFAVCRGAGGSRAEIPSAEPAGAAPIVLKLGDILSKRAFWIPAIASLLILLAMAGVQQNLGPISLEFRFSLKQLSAFVSVLSLSMIVGKLMFGALSDRLDAKGLYLFATALAALALGCVLLGPTNLRMLFVSGAIGAVLGSLMPLSSLIVASRFDKRAFSQVMGLLLPFMTVGYIGPVTLAWFRQATGSYQTGLWVFLGMAATAAILMIGLPRVPQLQPEPTNKPAARTRRANTVGGA